MIGRANASLPISEPSVTVPIFVDGLSAIETIGAVTHLIFTARQKSACEGARMERVVQARLIIPTDQLDIVGKLLLAGRIDPTFGIDENEEPIRLH